MNEKNTGKKLKGYKTEYPGVEIYDITKGVLKTLLVNGRLVALNENIPPGVDPLKFASYLYSVFDFEETSRILKKSAEPNKTNTTTAPEPEEESPFNSILKLDKPPSVLINSAPLSDSINVDLDTPPAPPVLENKTISDPEENPVVDKLEIRNPPLGEKTPTWSNLSDRTRELHNLYEKKLKPAIEPDPIKPDPKIKLDKSNKLDDAIQAPRARAKQKICEPEDPYTKQNGFLIYKCRCYDIYRTFPGEFKRSDLLAYFKKVYPISGTTAENLCTAYLTFLTHNKFIVQRRTSGYGRICEFIKPPFGAVRIYATD